MVYVAYGLALRHSPLGIALFLGVSRMPGSHPCRVPGLWLLGDSRSTPRVSGDAGLQAGWVRAVEAKKVAHHCSNTTETPSSLSCLASPLVTLEIAKQASPGDIVFFQERGHRNTTEMFIPESTHLARGELVPVPRRFLLYYRIILAMR